jgi:hypothetical protein
MVSISNVVTGAILLGGLSAFMGLGGFKGIGTKLGQGFGEFGTSLISGITGAFPKGVAGIDGKSSVQEIVSQMGIGDIVTGLPVEPRLATTKEKGLLALAGFVQSENLGGTINLDTGIFTNTVTKQPLGFTINSSGGVNTGTVGLSSATVAAQAALSKQYGIPTFDTKGNLSTFGGVTSGGGHTGGGGGQSGGSGGIGGSTGTSSGTTTGSISGHGMGGFRG